MKERRDLASEPTADQAERFRALSPSERYRWFVGMLSTMHGLATPEAKERWRAAKQASGGDFLGLATRFAVALDRADFDEAARALADDCIYETGKELLRGPHEIILSYRGNHTWACGALDRVEYRSRVEATAPGRALVTFEDRISHGANVHCYRCQQELHIGRSKLIERIVHREINGQREALESFFESVGIRR